MQANTTQQKKAEGLERLRTEHGQEEACRHKIEKQGCTDVMHAPSHTQANQ